jgi:hypothetical protein
MCTPENAESSIILMENRWKRCILERVNLFQLRLKKETHIMQNTINQQKEIAQ